MVLGLLALGIRLRACPIKPEARRTVRSPEGGFGGTHVGLGRGVRA